MNKRKREALAAQMIKQYHPARPQLVGQDIEWRRADGSLVARGGCRSHGETVGLFEELSRQLLL